MGVESESSLVRVPEVVVQFRRDDNSFVVSSSSIAASERVATRPSPTPTTTRRQRRPYDTDSCNYSDFCDNDFSRQIEAMVFEVETAYANRRMKKIKDSAARKPFSRKCAVEEDEASSEMTSEPIRKHTPNQSSRAKELDA